MDTLVTKILEVAKQTGKPRPAGGKGTVTLVANDDGSGAPGAATEGGFSLKNISYDQCCKT